MPNRLKYSTTTVNYVVMSYLKTFMNKMASEVVLPTQTILFKLVYSKKIPSTDVRHRVSLWLSPFKFCMYLSIYFPQTFQHNLNNNLTTSGNSI